MIKNLLEKPLLFIPYYLSAVKRNIEYLYIKIDTIFYHFVYYEILWRRKKEASS